MKPTGTRFTRISPHFYSKRWKNKYCQKGNKPGCSRPACFLLFLYRVEKDGAILAKADRAFFGGAMDRLLCKRGVSKGKKSRLPVKRAAFTSPKKA